MKISGAWRNVPERIGNWNTIYKNFNRLQDRLRAPAWRDPETGTQGARLNYKKFGAEPPDHAIGCSRGGLMTKSHLGLRCPSPSAGVRVDVG